MNSVRLFLNRQAIVFPVACREVLQHLKKVRGGWSFPNPLTGESYVARQPWIKELRGIAGVKKFLVCHLHLAAFLLEAAGVEITIIQSILRLKNERHSQVSIQLA